ncbi:hypothetical protein KNO15_10690 [Leifsonia shinshuensis]|uniref:hypothetical protein n=1 Tax=Leifsonia shinshuensis TaxID=150026 RepID=UPI001F50BF8E|nr:hypothetical protein [Leifsonia shinshuensis]MCI0157161.1 hypothetical protein [Leifsonia shinshuensis]
MGKLESGSNSTNTEGAAGRRRRRFIAAIVGLMLALAPASLAAGPATAAPPSGAVHAGWTYSWNLNPTCSNRSQQVISAFPSAYAVWLYNNDYHWNGHKYAWSFYGTVYEYVLIGTKLTPTKVGTVTYQC